MPTPQAGLNPLYGGARATGSIVVRGVVIATYFADEEDRPGIVGQARGLSIAQHDIKAVACDVLTYGGPFRFFLPRIPVAQPRHALNDHTGLWIPRPSTVDLRTGNAPLLPQGIVSGSGDNTSAVTQISNQERVSDPRDLDGDHVLVDFVENDPQQAFIRSEQLPHPRANFRLTTDTGRAVRSRFRGVIQEVDANGNLLLDARAGNDGSINAAGEETPANAVGFGNVTIEANAEAEVNVVGRNDDDSNEQFRLRLKKDELLLDLVAAISLLIQGNQTNTTMQVGDGAVAVAIANRLQSYIDTMVKTEYDAHSHPEAALRTLLGTAGAALSAAGADPTLISLASVAAASLASAGSALTSAASSVPDSPSTSFPSYDTAITSTKVTIPDG